jgi:hypothetical protein
MSRFSDVFFVDASSANTINVDLENIARAKEVGKSPQDALAWLARQHEEWLVLFNNADDITFNLRNFFPICSHGNILITSRNQDMRSLAPSPKSYCKVSDLMSDEATDLLLLVAGHGNGHYDEVVQAMAIVKVKY